MVTLQFLRTTCPDHGCVIKTSASISHSYSPKLRDHLRFVQLSSGVATYSATFSTRSRATTSDAYSNPSELANITWDNLGFNPLPTDYMYVMKCPEGENFLDGKLQPFAKIQLNPFSSVLNYGQGVIEGLKACKKEDESILLFRPKEHGLRMQAGAERLYMPAPTIDQFLEAVKVTVSANKRWIPPPNKGFLHIRPLLFGSGPVLHPTTSPEFTFLIYVTPVRNYFEGDVEPINLVVDGEVHRAVPGGVGGIKAIGNYAAIMKAQSAAKANGFHDVLYLDSVCNTYLEEVSTANIFVVKGKTICTPDLRGTILPGITRKTVIEIACSQGFQVEERLISVQELFDSDEVFATGNAVGLLPVGSITYMGRRVTYTKNGFGAVSQQIRSQLRNVQMGLTKDKMGWTIVLK